MYKHILVALDGSQLSRSAGRAALAIARATGARIAACHVYGVDIHRRRFVDMEPGLPRKYQQDERLADLRSAHGRLMDEGFRALSAGYVEDFVTDCRDCGVSVDAAVVEGRSYVGILHLARSRNIDLVALGAWGIGALGDGILGGTTSRVLHAASCDVLVARRDPGCGPVLTGADGSERAVSAVAKASALGEVLGKPVEIAAVYDPYFHTHVFRVMAGSLSAERQEEVGLGAQETLHDEIINEGLARLYGEFLEDARRRAAGRRDGLSTVLLKGKAYDALNTRARQCDSDLVVIGRHGHHREAESNLGSNAEALVRTCAANVLVVGGVEVAVSNSDPNGVRTEPVATGSSLVWDPDAEARLQRVPSFVRMMARRAVESAVREAGRSRVTGEDCDDVAARCGMGSPGGAR